MKNLRRVLFNQLSIILFCCPWPIFNCTSSLQWWYSIFRINPLVCHRDCLFFNRILSPPWIFYLKTRIFVGFWTLIWLMSPYYIRIYLSLGILTSQSQFKPQTMSKIDRPVWVLSSLVPPASWFPLYLANATHHRTLLVCYWEHLLLHCYHSHHHFPQFP